MTNREYIKKAYQEVYRVPAFIFLKAVSNFDDPEYRVFKYVAEGPSVEAFLNLIDVAQDKYIDTIANNLSFPDVTGLDLNFKLTSTDELIDTVYGKGGEKREAYEKRYQILKESLVAIVDEEGGPVSFESLVNIFDISINRTDFYNKMLMHLTNNMDQDEYVKKYPVSAHSITLWYDAQKSEDLETAVACNNEVVRVNSLVTYYFDGVFNTGHIRKDDIGYYFENTSMSRYRTLQHMVETHVGILIKY